MMDLVLLIGLISAGAALLLSVTLVSLAYIKLCRRRKDPVDLERGAKDAKVADGLESPQSEPSVTKGDELVRQFSWPEIESLTGNFASGSVIGVGGFSTVYLARLPQNLAAVKVHPSSERLHRVFSRELDVLLRLRHPHIVRLIGYCDDRPEDGGALVLDYVPVGTLHDRLHGGLDTAVLSWARRVSIAYRMAEAVQYLHDRCDPQVVHGDIKAANVLLDDRMDPKLCDFGSSTMGFSAAVRSSAAERPTMVGSPGYVDPHYLRTGMVSKKSDVYGYGVLLLELVTGAEAFCSESERPLAATVVNLLKEGRVAEVPVDPRLCGKFDVAEAAAVGELALRCVGEQPSLRPSMAEVLRILRERVPSSSISAVGDDSSVHKPDLYKP